MTEDGPRRRRELLRNGAVVLGLALVLLIPLNRFAIRYIGEERALYRDDQVAYWVMSSGLARGLTEQPWSAVSAVAASVAQRDVNLLPAVPVALAMTVTGDGRLAYVLAVYNIYGLAVALTLMLAVRFGPPAGSRPALRVAAFATLAALLLMPAMWRPVLIGYLGLGGVAIAIAALALYLQDDPQEAPASRLLMVGSLIALLAVFRRWYGVWSLSFGVIVVVDAAWSAWRNRPLDRQRLLRAARGPALVGGTAIVTLLVLAAPAVSARLGAGYLEEFSPFTVFASWRERLGAVVGEYGLLTMAAVAAAAVSLIRSPATRRIGVLVSLQIGFCYLLFTRLQDHDAQHWYIYVAGMLLLLATAVARLVTGADRRRRAVIVAAAISLGLLTTLAVYSKGAAPVVGRLGPLLPAHRVQPLDRGDLDEVRRLLTTVDRLVTAEPGHVYVLGCSLALNDQALAFANRSLGTEFVSLGLILQSAHVDRRDGFPESLLDARYVLVPDEPQYNLRPAEQQVIVIPTESFHRGEGIARAFQPLPGEFVLEDGVRVTIWRRVRPFTDEDIAALSAALRERYPDRPDIYTPPQLGPSR